MDLSSIRGAYTDLDDIWEYIAGENLGAADRVIEEIFNAIRSLIAFPDQGHERPDLSGRTLRFQAVGEYLIAYAPNEKPLLVIGVLHGRRSPRVIAAILEQRS